MIHVYDTIKEYPLASFALGCVLVGAVTATSVLVSQEKNRPSSSEEQSYSLPVESRERVLPLEVGLESGFRNDVILGDLAVRVGSGALVVLVGAGAFLYENHRRKRLFDRKVFAKDR